MSPAVPLRSLPAASASLAALAILWRFRPEWPALPESLSSPVTTTLLQQLALVGAWLLAVVLILLLLVQSLGGLRARRRLDTVAGWHAAAGQTSRPRRCKGTPGILRPLIPEPSLLVVAPRDSTTTPPGEVLVSTSSEPAAPGHAEPDGRPLISLLGPLTIQGGKRSRRGLRARALELIAFLALRREGAQRDAVLEALWPGDDPERSRHRLYQAVRDARRLLGDAVASERDRYWLDRERVRVDVDELEHLLDDASRVPAGGRLQLLVEALSLFRDEPLAGSDFGWCAGESRRLRADYVLLLEEVGRAHLEAGDGRAALDAAERGISVDVLNEDLWRLALKAEGELGMRESIEERYNQLRELLDEKLGLEPAVETRSLYLRLLGQT